MPEFIENVNSIFEDYKIKVNCLSFKEINHFNIFELELQPGCKIKSIEGISNELQLRLKYKNKPIFIIDDGKMKMIFANDPSKIELQDLLDKKVSFGPTDLILGIDFNGEIVSADLAKMPHMLVAGTTGSGKSVFLHSIINNFLKTYRVVDLYLFDPKFVEFNVYKNIKPNNGTCVFVHNTYKEILEKVKMLKAIMDKRFEILSGANCKNIQEFNSKMKSKMKFIVCVIDEFADLAGKDKKAFEELICSIASKSRSCGVHICLATQRPSADVVTGLISANFPTRICFKVASQINSRIVLDQNGAENLMGAGDGIMINNGKVIRFQGAFCE